MNNSPLVSIGIVCYNSEAYIKLALESALGINYPNLEIIVCDDNSTDNTWALLNSYKNDRLRIYGNNNNIGEYNNREKCVSVANGKYFIFIDGDDYIYPHAITFLVDMMENFPKCAIGVMHKPRIDVIYPIISTPREFLLGEFFGDGFNKLSFANLFFRTDMLKQYLPFPEKTTNGDDYLRYQICTKHDILILNDSLTWWRQTPNQASSQLNHNINAIKKHIYLKKEALNKYIHLLNETEVIEANKNIYIEIAGINKMLIKKGKLRILIQMIKEFGLKIRYAFSKKTAYSLYPYNSPSNPKRLSLDQNPYYKLKP